MNVSTALSSSLRKIAQYISIYGAFRFPLKLFEHWRKFKFYPRGRISATKTPDGDTIFLRSRMTDLSIFWEIFFEGQYEVPSEYLHQEIVSRYRSILESGHTPLIVDAGANIGLATIYMQKIFPDAKFILIEASAETAEMAKRNAKDHHNVTVLNNALWSEKKTLWLSGQDDAAMTMVQDSASYRGKESSVEALPMSDIIQMFPDAKLFLCKIDIEGAEHEVFAKNNAWLEQSPVIFLEPHDMMIANNRSMAGLLKWSDYQNGSIVIKGATLIFVPDQGYA